MNIEAREEICRIGKSLFDRGYVAWHGRQHQCSYCRKGPAISSRLPTRAWAFLDAERLARLDANGKQIAGDRASKTMALHRQIYAAATQFDPATACVIHTHSTHCVAMTLSSHAEELLAAITPYFVMKVGHVPIVPYDRPGAPVVATAVADVIRRYGERGTPIRAVMLERLGPNVWHDSPASAMAVLEELEETAHLVNTESRAHPAAERRPDPRSPPDLWRTLVTTMPKFAANLSMLYQELPFLDRFAAAARDGFRAVEYLFPYAFSAADIAARLRDNGLQQVLFNAPPGNWETGERGFACLPGRDEEFRCGDRRSSSLCGSLALPAHSRHGRIAAARS